LQDHVREERKRDGAARHRLRAAEERSESAAETTKQSTIDLAALWFADDGRGRNDSTVGRVAL
jgi:hypothetical protein